jgi:hypothetical protein
MPSAAAPVIAPQSPSLSTVDRRHPMPNGVPENSHKI